MPKVILVSGSKVVTQQGDTTVAAPAGQIYLDSTVTNVLGDLVVQNTTTIAKDAFVEESVYISNLLRVASTVQSTSTVTGAVVINGGVGVAKNIHVGGNAVITGTIRVVGNTGTVIIRDDDKNVGNPYNAPLAPDVYGEDLVGAATANLQRQTGTIFVAGGVGIQKDLNVGGFIYGRVAEANTSLRQLVTSTNINANYYPLFAAVPNGFSYSYSDNTSGTANPGGLTYNPFQGKMTMERGSITSSDNATNTMTGAFTVTGGVGIGRDLYVGQTGFIDDFFTKSIRSTEGMIRINPAGNNVTEIVGDIRVLGTNPIGTYPVTSNTLYVTMDGDDTNDGRAMDPSRACRTIGGALKSPYYQPGTTVKVAAGHYLEDNPLQLKPYTSIMGTDLRTCSVEPINKTQDLFHLNSGCYLAFMQFLNGRSGLIEGPYLSEFNRGAYCTAFPPLEGDDRIDLFHSPYIQNCTNLSGPWLKDGTMFVPNQTVQAPKAVGLGTWEVNTTTLTITVTTGTIERGMALNAGQTNPGFFNARTLLLANKPFLQEQVVKFVDDTFNSGSFVYNTTSCFRDTGLIVDSIATDLLSNSISDSVFAGLQYWNQGAYTGTITTEINATIDAFTYLKDQTVDLVNAINGPGPAVSVSTLFDTFLTLLISGTAGVTDQIISNTTTNADPNFVATFDTIESNKETLVDATLLWIENAILANSLPNFPISFDFDRVKCRRDIGYVLDSVAYDIKHTGNKQSIKSGVYYYSFNGSSSAIPNEIPQTTAAYNFIKSLIPYIVKGEELPSTYQTGTVQVTNLNAATEFEVEALQNKLDVITSIIRSGPDIAPEKTPMPLVDNTTTAVANAIELLRANRLFIQNEVLAYIDSQLNNFEYSREKCYRDVGILVENCAYDAAFGGNEKSVQSGLAYYDGVISRIAGQETQTISAIDYLNYLSQLVINNEPAPDLYEVTPGVTTATNLQVINWVLTDGDVAGRSIRDCFNITTGIIANGPASAPQIYKGTNADAAFVSAEILMQANRKFIQEDTINWVNNTFMAFPYNKTKCRRDTGLIVDSIAYDLLHYTTGFSQSTFAGLQYWNQDGYVADFNLEVNPTISAVTYLRDLAVKIVQNITPLDDLVLRYQNTVTQVTNLEPATPVEASTLYNNFDIIIEIISGNSLGWTDRIIPNGSLSPFLAVQNAYDLMQANKEYLAAEVNAYIAISQEGFTYDIEKCKRDIGYMIDAVCFDLIHTGNRQSIQTGLYYYGFDTTQTTIRNQEIQTTDAFNYLSSIAQSIVQKITVPPLQDREVQVFDLPAGDIFSAGIIAEAVSTITNIITNGPAPQYDAAAIAMTASSTATVFNSFNLLLANKEFIKEQVIQYIDNTYNSTPFTYDAVKCARDTGLIVDSVALDLLQNSDSESIFAGLQYWTQSGYNDPREITTTTAAINYVKDQVAAVALGAGGAGTENTVMTLFDKILEILANGTDGITDDIISNGIALTATDVVLAYNAIIAAKQTIQWDTINFITVTWPSFYYNTSTCFRDVGYIIDSVAFDLLHDGNKQSIKSGVYYYKYLTTSTEIPGEINETTAAYEFIADIIGHIVKSERVPVRFQSVEDQVIYLPPASDEEVFELERKLNLITDIINNGPDFAPNRIPINLVSSSDQNVINAYEAIIANRNFIIAETIAFINTTFTNKSFTYNEELCYRDTGLIVDAVSQDILLGGNYKSIEAGLAYWNKGYNLVTGQETTTTMALNHARDIALKIIANQPVIPQVGTKTRQIINPFFQYGGDYMPQEAVKRNFSIITRIIERGPTYAPPKFMGGGIFAMVGINGADVLNPPYVTSVSQISTGTYLVGINTQTVSFGTNATVYFGDVLTFPYGDKEMEDFSLAYSGSTSTWDQRKVDPIGSMGGSLVDGAVISARSPINSFVYDAFTQLTQGGRGVRITNDGYAQLVSVFTIFASVGVQVDNGGIASIVNSNANFGDLCLVAKGYGLRKFSGTIYNPPFKAYPDSPGEDGLNQYYPEGFWPNGARVQVFCPDIEDRPHISLVMEVEPYETYFNEQGLPGFLNATPSLAVLATGTITITGIDTTGIAIGNTVYIRDEEGSQFESNQFLLDQNGNPTATPNPDYGKWYAATGTTVVDIGYQSVTLSGALTHGGGDPNNNNFFTLLFAGNAYYTVLSSVVADNPRPEGVNILSTASTGGEVSQIPLHIASLRYLNSLTNSIISNTPVVPLQNTSSQTILPLVLGGSAATPFIDLRFGEMIDIIEAPNVEAAEAVIPKALRTKTGPEVAGAGNAVTLIKANIDFLADEIVAFVDQNTLTNSTFTYDETICRRDAGYIIDSIFYDVALGTNYNAVTSGLAYRRGTASSQSVIANELVPTLTAFNYIKERAETVFGSNNIALFRSETAFTELMQILANGEQLADAVTFTNPTGASASVIAAKDQLVINKEFIKDEIIAWIAVQIAGNIAPFTSSFTYNVDKCARDVGYMIDAICYDILYGGDSASVDAAYAYFDGAVAVLPPGETAPTAAAIARLRNVVGQVIRGLSVTVSAGNTSVQSTSGAVGTVSEANIANTLLLYVEGAITAGNTSGIPVKTNPDITWATVDIQNAVTAFDAERFDIIDDMVALINDEFNGEFFYDRKKCRRDVKITLQRLIYDLETGGRYNSVMVGLSYWSRTGTHFITSLGENVRRTDLFPDGATVNFYQRSYISASGYVFEYVGAGTNYAALPQRGVADPVQTKETVQLDGGKVFFTSTDQNGDFRIGPGLVISQATGVLSGRTFTKSLFANLTPFILAIEGGGG